jgi:hypothetical protein
MGATKFYVKRGVDRDYVWCGDDKVEEWICVARSPGWGRKIARAMNAARKDAKKKKASRVARHHHKWIFRPRKSAKSWLLHYKCACGATMSER